MSYKFAPLLFGFILGVPALAGQTAPPTPEPIRFPSLLRTGEARFALGFSMIGMPDEIVQEAASIHWPLIGFDTKVGLPSHFYLGGSVNTEVLTNHFEIDGGYAFRLTDKLHADASVGVAYWFGQLMQFGFKDKAHGWYTYPQVSLGYDFGRMSLTAQAKFSIVNSLVVKNGEQGIDANENFFNGLSYRITLEQLFWGKTTVGLSFQMNYMKFYYPQWMLFPTYNRYFWMPEAMIRFSL